MNAIKMSDLYKALGFKGGKIPKGYYCTQKEMYVNTYGFTGTGGVPNVKLKVTITITGNESRQHRVHVTCPTCGYLQSAGRLHQHQGRKKCLKLKAEVDHMINPLAREQTS